MIVKTKREGISSRTRFEVFKRDGFKCQYCGRAAPSVALVVDHVEPVSSGGKNNRDNLISACVDCNAGKSDKPLSYHLPSVRLFFREIEGYMICGLTPYFIETILTASASCSEAMERLESALGEVTFS